MLHFTDQLLDSLPQHETLHRFYLAEQAKLDEQHRLIIDPTAPLGSTNFSHRMLADELKTITRAQMATTIVAKDEHDVQDTSLSELAIFWRSAFNISTMADSFTRTWALISPDVHHVLHETTPKFLSRKLPPFWKVSQDRANKIAAGKTWRLNSEHLKRIIEGAVKNMSINHVDKNNADFYWQRWCDPAYGNLAQALPTIMAKGLALMREKKDKLMFNGTEVMDTVEKLHNNLLARCLANDVKATRAITDVLSTIQKFYQAHDLKLIEGKKIAMRQYQMFDPPRNWPGPGVVNQIKNWQALQQAGVLQDWNNEGRLTPECLTAGLEYMNTTNNAHLQAPLAMLAIKNMYSMKYDETAKLHIPEQPELDIRFLLCAWLSNHGKLFHDHIAQPELTAPLFGIVERTEGLKDIAHLCPQWMTWQDHNQETLADAYLYLIKNIYGNSSQTFKNVRRKLTCDLMSAILELPKPVLEQRHHTGSSPIDEITSLFTDMQYLAVNVENANNHILNLAAKLNQFKHDSLKSLVNIGERTMSKSTKPRI